jgi:hypothetical protein
MSVYVYSVCVVLCVRSGLATGWSPVQGVLPTVCRLRNWKSGQGPTKGCRAIDRDRYIDWFWDGSNSPFLPYDICHEICSIGVCICKSQFCVCLLKISFQMWNKSCAIALVKDVLGVNSRHNA